MSWVLLSASAQAYGSMFDFQSTIVIGERPFQLVGRTQFVAGFFFKVYEAGLYLDQAPVSEENIVEKPLYLELVYSRSIKAQQFRNAAESVLGKLLSEEQSIRYASYVEALHSRYQDVGVGDRYGLSSVPGKGLTLFFNNTEVINIPDDAFAKDYVKIWLGDHRDAEKMKKGLLP